MKGENREEVVHNVRPVSCHWAHCVWSFDSRNQYKLWYLLWGTLGLCTACAHLFCIFYMKILLTCWNALYFECQIPQPFVDTGADDSDILIVQVEQLFRFEDELTFGIMHTANYIIDCHDPGVWAINVTIRSALASAAPLTNSLVTIITAITGILFIVYLDGIVWPR